MGQLLPNLRHFFRPREIFLHDGSNMRRLHISTRVQLACAGIVATTLTGAVLSLGQIAATAVSASSAASEFAARQSERHAASSQLASLQDEVEAVKAASRAEVSRLEARQAFLAAILSGEGDPAKLAALIPAPHRAKTQAASDLISMFGKIDQDQLAMAGILRAKADDRYADAAGAVSKLGLSPDRVMGGMGGPYEPVPSGAIAASQATVSGKADPQFRALFNSWKRLDQVENTLVSIPSDKPVQIVTVNSGFGVRSDPFRGGRAMHAGVDMPGPYGTPIYATADAVVGRTGWVGGYGNLIELEHGKGIQTRYGHLSSILVAPGATIKRGQQIGLMGSTGRSTGNHLHYEVRIDGAAVNPIPFLQSTDYLLALQQRQSAATAMGGPIEGKTSTGSK
jgi:murein DD-endopeptidase MepM/ murein hydrolase activator NlpD